MINVGEKVISYLNADPAAKKAFEVLSPHGDIFAVGGAPRDVILGKKPKDVDLLAKIPAEVIQDVLSKVPGGHLNFAGKNFGVFHFHYNGGQVEIALPRVEQSTGDGHKDFDVQSHHDIPLEQDLPRRDFTGNAIAVNLKTGEMVDPLNGALDLSLGVMRHTNPNAFKDDPLRTVRGLTMRSRHGLEPADETRQAMAEHGHLLKALPGDRFREEMDKILKGNEPHEAIKLGRDLGLLEHFLPEVHNTVGFDQQNPYHNLPLDEHLLQVLQNTAGLTDDHDVRLAALLHDIGKPASKWVDEKGVGHYYQGKEGQGANHEEVGARMAEDLMRRWNYPATRINRVTHLVNNHMFPEFNSPRGARKFLNRAGSVDAAHDLLNLRQADHMGKGNDAATAGMVNRMRGLVNQEAGNAAMGVQDLAISGRDVMKALNAPPGPEIGQKMKTLLDYVIEHPELNTREQLLNLLKQGSYKIGSSSDWISDLGISWERPNKSKWSQ